MENSDRLEVLLTEIRDMVREQTDMARRSAEQQDHAMRTLAVNQRYHRVVTVGAILVLLLAATMLVLPA